MILRHSNQIIVKMIVILSLLTRRIPTIHSFALPTRPAVWTTTCTNTVCTTSRLQLRNYNTGRMVVDRRVIKPQQQQQRQRQWSSSSSLSNPSGRYFLSSFSRSGRDTFQEGVNILTRFERDVKHAEEEEKEFNLFEDISKQQIEFRVGLPIMVEVISFGPLGASVAVIGKGSHDASVVKLSDSSNPLAIGLIYQSEIQIYRESRQYVDVVLGEILPAFVERVREDGKIDVSLRVIGGRAKVDKWSTEVLQRLEEMGEIPLGDKSTPLEVTREFPGMSKTDFKKCIGALFERQLVFPFPHSILPYEEGLAIRTAQREAEGMQDHGNGTGTGTGRGESTNSTGSRRNESPDNSNRDNSRNGNNGGNRAYRPNDDGYSGNNRSWNHRGK